MALVGTPILPWESDSRCSFLPDLCCTMASRVAEGGAGILPALANRTEEAADSQSEVR